MTNGILDNAVCLWRTLREWEWTIDCRLIRIRLNEVYSELTESQKKEYWERTQTIIQNGGTG